MKDQTSSPMQSENSEEKNEKSNRAMKFLSGPGITQTVVVYLAMLFIFLWAWSSMNPTQYNAISYSDFRMALQNGQITEATLTDTEIRGFIAPPLEGQMGPFWSSPEGGGAPLNDSPPSQNTYEPAPFAFRTVRVNDPNLVDDLMSANVDFNAEKSSYFGQILLAWVLPMLLIFFLWSLFARRMRSASTSVLSIGKSRAKLSSDTDVKVTFEDVAGCEEAKHELVEVVEFLKYPNRFEAVGARIPKGVLLLGPPGTGKTLLARAVAGEANVPFFSISGSDFVEMFVGVGSARVRDMFEEAKKKAPCIVFIDEIDAIGRQRGVQMGVTNDEREQTLNQLLTQLDGFEPNLGVIVLAATNRPDVLDRALLRPGRFDRQVLVDAPDLSGREAILKVHSRNKPMSSKVDLKRIALSTPGFSGADLANTINEAALLAARENATVIEQKHLEEAIEKVVAGPERRSRRLNEDERKRVAYHEVGHALVSLNCKYSDPIHKISIVPRGRAALGYTLQLPASEQFLATRAALLDKIRGLMGGRAAEELVFGEVSTGAENDLEKATQLAQQMICFYGMGETTGLVHIGQRTHNNFLNNETNIERNCSQETATHVDVEVKQILDRAYIDAKRILTKHRFELDTIAHELIEHESLDSTQLKRLVAGVSKAV